MCCRPGADGGARTGGHGYAQAAGLPALYGLYATMVPLLAYAVFGPSRILVLGRIRPWLV